MLEYKVAYQKIKSRIKSTAIAKLALLYKSELKDNYSD